MHKHFLSSYFFQGHSYSLYRDTNERISFSFRLPRGSATRNEDKPVSQPAKQSYDLEQLKWLEQSRSDMWLS